MADIDISLGILGDNIVIGAFRRIGEVAIDALGSAFSAVADFAVDSFKGAIEAQEGIDKLTGSIARLGDKSPITIDGAMALADQFKNLVGGSDDVVLAMTNVGLRFDKIGADILPRFIEQSADLATTLKLEPTKAAELLGKVLQDLGTDGVGSIGKLKAAVIQLTDEQEKQIQKLVELGDVTGAQTVLMDALASTTGGAAATASETLAGKWAIFQETIADAGEGVALALLPPLTELADKVLPLIVPLVETVAGALSEFIADMASGEDPIGGIANLVYSLANAFGLDGEGLFKSVIQLRDPFEKFVTWVQTNWPIVQQAIIDGWNAAQPALIALKDFILNTVVPAFQNAVAWVITNWPMIQAKIAEVWAQVQPVLQAVWDFIQTVVIPAFQSAVAWVIENWPAIYATIQSVMADVQNVIDGSFDKLAANFSVFRFAGQNSVGEVRFYTSATPTQSIPIPLGTVVTGGGIQFRTTRSVTLSISQLASYWNPSTRQYSITVPVRSVAVGRATNVGARQINASGVYGLSVINDAATFGGTEEETNAQLAARARTALSSVDTGTTQGYLQTAAGVPGTVQNMVVRAGNPLMQRDYDTVLKRHMGGKVDVWARGSRSVDVTDTFAFTYERRCDVQFVVIGDVSEYTFRAVSDEITPANPIASMLNYPTLGLGLKNVTTDVAYDLTNVTYLNYNTIRLDNTLSQPPVTLTDIILGDFRFRLGNRHLFSRQPVNSVSGVTGEVTGALDLSLYTLIHPNSPLGLGCSTQAGDYLQINQSADPTVASPSGNLITVTDELHLLTGFYPEFLYNLGADTLSIVVTNQLGTVTYKGPFDPSGSPDYTVIEGTDTEAAGIKRTTTSAIADGETVLISYVYYENFTVTYQTNLVTSVLQQALDDSAHATADVLAKQAVLTPVDITATVVLKKGADRTNTDIAIRNNLQYLVGTLKLGDPMRRSDVLAEMDNTAGVSYVVVPLTKMVRAPGYQIVRNDLTTSSFGDAFRVNAWSNTRSAVWLILQGLDAPTSTGGGNTSMFRGVYQDDNELSLQLTAPQNLGMVSGQAYIIGSDGLAIPGYGTEPVKNRVLVSLPIGDSPSNHTYWCSYVTAEDTGDHDIDPNSMEYLVLGDVSITFNEDR